MFTSIRTGRTVTMRSSAFFTIKKQQKKMEIRNIKDVKKYWYTKRKVKSLFRIKYRRNMNILVCKNEYL